MSPVKGKGKKLGKKKVAAAPLQLKQSTGEKKRRERNPLFKASDKTYGIGQSVSRKRDLTRVMLWPKYVKLERHKKILMKRLKVPPSIHQFQHCVDKNTARRIFELANRYAPEGKLAKKSRRKKRALERASGKPDVPETTRRRQMRQGINEVTKLIERKKTPLVLIANDVDPIELVIFLPALCRRMEVPYCVIKDKSRLGIVVHRKTACCLAFPEPYPEDRHAFSSLVEAITVNFNERYDEIRKQWGGGTMSRRSVAKQEKLERAKDREMQQRLT